MPSHRSRARDPAAVNSTGMIDEQGLSALLDGLKVGVAYLSRSGRILYCNRSFADLVGCLSRRSALGGNLKNLVSASGWRPLAEALQKAVHAPMEGDLRIDSAAGIRYLKLSLGPLEHSPFAGADIHASAVDITEVVEANAAVGERENSLRSLAARILEVQDLERRRIARDLHDVTGQEIAAISMALGSVINRAQSSGRPDLTKEVSDAMNLLRKVQDEIRTLSYVLHPPLLDERGLSSALEWYVEGFRKRSGIEVALRVPSANVRLPVEEEIALFRVLQEGLTNVLRHSKSKRAEISLSITKNEVELSILDEGVGISPSQIDRARASTSRAAFGVGIPGMRERLSQLGGRLELHSRKSGTRLVARLPRQHAERSEQELEQEVPRTQRERDLHTTEETSSAHKRILIADDHDVVRQGIRALLTNQADWTVCGEAANGAETVSKTKELRPDLVLLDLTMPGIGGLTAARQIRTAGIDTKLLVFTTHDYQGLEHVIKAAGCDGYVQKARAGEDLVAGIKSVLQGNTFFPPHNPPKPVTA